jgi:hypothetical protein
MLEDRDSSTPVMPGTRTQDSDIIARTPELTVATSLRAIPLVVWRTLANSSELSEP